MPLIFVLACAVCVMLKMNNQGNSSGECSSGSHLHEGACVICRASITSSDTNVAEVQRGLERLIEFSEKYNDVELHTYLLRKPEVVRVHNDCRRHYTSKRRYEQKCKKSDDNSDSTAAQPKVLRSLSEAFNWKTHCFFCSQTCLATCSGQSGKTILRRVETLEIRDSLLEQCTLRGDTWGLEVQGKLLACNDLVAEEAVYHNYCHRDFYRTSSQAACGRPVDAVKSEAFERMCEWMEMNDNELLTLQDVMKKAQTLVPHSEELYTEVWLKQKLRSRYGDHIQFNEVRGRRNVICWKEMASYIINEKWHDDQKGDRSEHIVITAAKLLRAVIIESNYSMDSYPSVEDFQHTREFMPNLLQLFLDNLIKPEEKKCAIGHCIVQSVRPRTAIAPIPFAVGISVDHLTGSKYVLNLLHRLGLSCSYDEVRRYKQSVAYNEATVCAPLLPQGFTQYAADNVDHDFCTLDGSGTLHAMGIISITNCPPHESTVATAEEPITRVKPKKSTDVAKMNHVPLLRCTLPKEMMAGVTFRPYFHCDPCILSPSLNLDSLWHFGWFLHNDDELRPSWAGFNSSVVRGDPVHASVIRLQPMIDRNPNDPSCIYSTLCFVASECKKLNIQTPVITFDQPLWLKAVNIVNNFGLNVICRLGTFHLEMSFLGSLGTLMAGSGLSDIMECCYGPNTVKQIMTGKAFARAVRGHFMVEAALTVMLLKLVLASGTFSADMTEVQAFYTHVVNNGFSNDCEFPPGLFRIEEALADLKRKLAIESRTAKLWLQYVNYVSLLKMLWRAERTADWQLHLVTVMRMINLFAATGHTNYAKCGRLYIEMMSELPVTHPELHDQLMSGGHIARRSNKLWSGLSIDLTIEQALMRAVKGHGGLTHGRGVTESVRNTWLTTVHKTAAIKTALAQFADVEYCHDLMQHPELGKSRAKRDNSDLLKLLGFLECHNPFQSSDPRLHSLTSGIAPSESEDINCDDVEDVGSEIMDRINGQPFSEVHLKRKDQVKTLAHVANAATSEGKKHLQSVDPTVLFHRLIVIMQRSPDIKPYFSYELSPQPTSLFKDNFMRKTDKSLLAKEIRKGVPDASFSATLSVPVIDGGYLLHAVTWSPGAIYADIAEQYVQHVARYYGSRAIIVFDGYCNGPSTKDHEHRRRAHQQAPDIVVDGNKVAYRDQSAFLANETNKCAIVAMIITSLQAAGFSVHQADDDADTLVVKVALQLAVNNTVVSVIANDTDILIMLVAHYQPHMTDIYMYTVSGQNVTSIGAVAVRLGESVTRRLLVIHAISGCDTTSCLFGRGKIGVFNKLSKWGDIETLLHTLESPAASQDEVMTSGCQLLSLIYASNLTVTLNHLRFKMYVHAAGTSPHLPRPEKLPPTQNAARFHLYRVHLQVVQWKLLSTKALNPTEWGWRLHDGKYIPVATDLAIGPPDLLKVACCKCRTESKRQCGTRLCLCVRYGQSCVAACKNCNGVACENAQESIADEYDETDDGICEETDAVFEHDDEDIMFEEFIDYYMPWELEEEVVTGV